MSESPQFCVAVTKSLPSANSLSTHSRTVASSLQNNRIWLEKSRKRKRASSPNCGRPWASQSFARWFILYIFLVSNSQFMHLPFWQGPWVQLWETFAWQAGGSRRRSLCTRDRVQSSWQPGSWTGELVSCSCHGRGNWGPAWYCDRHRTSGLGGWLGAQFSDS